MRAATVGTIDFSGTISLDTFVTGSPSSLTYSSTSDFETESTASFFHDKGMTLGSLIGASSILERSSGRSVRRRRLNNAKGEKNDKCNTLLFSLCSSCNFNAERPPSLRHYLDVERKTAKNLFANNAYIAPPQSSLWNGSNIGGRTNTTSFDHIGSSGVPALFSCLCGHSNN